MRNSFLFPIPEIEMAASFLDAAANAIINEELELSRSLILQADLKEICEFASKIIGVINFDIHWQSNMPKETIPKNERTKLRMPKAKDELAVFIRDGWRCRYCDCRVISKKARAFLSDKFPLEARWGKTGKDKHCALSTLTASLDHITPHSRGGNNDDNNLVTACTPCQFGRNQWTLEEVGFSNPLERSPIVDSWDGLTRLILK